MDIIQHLRRSHLSRLLLVGMSMLVLLIPVSMIRGLIEERRLRHDDAEIEVTSKWGLRQILTGPVLILPYTTVENRKSTSGEDTARRVLHNAVFLPRQLHLRGRLTTETRGRGIFQVPVYNLTMTVEGEFERPRLDELNVDPASVEWSEAHLAIGISDVRALRSSAKVSWNDAEAEFLPGTRGFAEAGQGVHAPVPVGAEDAAYRFSFPLSMNGSSSLYVVPFAEESEFQLTGDTANPNFQGNWLPSVRDVSDQGFEATWNVSYLGRNYPQMWVSGSGVEKWIENSRFGVELREPLDLYRLTDRSVKYAGLFILLTFTSIWLIEVLVGAPVHPIQYLMLGAGLCLFYLLELSLSEHIGFSAAYGLASLAVISMVAFYSRTLFKRGQKSGAVALGVTALYSYLYVVLTNEDAALLMGSIGLFIILAAIMFVTRGIDWYGNRAATRPSDIPGHPPSSTAPGTLS